MNSPSGLSQRYSPAVQSNWLLSFGDLLTLLLCFFLSVLSLSPLNPAYKPSEKSELKRNVSAVSETATDDRDSKTAGGIELANYPGTVVNPPDGSFGSNIKELDIWLREMDFRDGNLELGPEAREQLKSQVFGSAYELRSVRIEGCAETQETKTEAAWAASLSRILTLRSQMIDAGVAGRMLSYRVLGPDCATLRGSSGQEQAVARVRFEQKLSHG